MAVPRQFSSEPVRLFLKKAFQAPPKNSMPKGPDVSRADRLQPARYAQNPYEYTQQNKLKAAYSKHAFQQPVAIAKAP